MPNAADRPVSRAEWTAGALTVLALLAVARFVPLAPEVETDFFFSRQDPQLRASIAIEQRFGGSPQILLRAATDDLRSLAYRSRVGELATALGTLEGITQVNSIVTADVWESPLWGTLLLSPLEPASYIIASVDPAADQESIVRQVETLVSVYHEPAFRIQLSGVPYVIEQIRRSLFRDLVIFSSVALGLFAAVVGVVYRRARVVGGMVLTCLTACATTLLVSRAVGISIGLLTANIVTIVFVLTLSHIVFLSSNWARLAGASDHDDLVAAAIRETRQASFWCMATTMLGFLSLLIASAKPLRELGMAGAIGTLAAIVIAYTLYPPFLRGLGATTTATSLAIRWPTEHPRRWLAGFALVAVVGAMGVSQVQTDPSLLSYFKTGSAIRSGLDAVDRDGGSSPLNIVVRDPTGRTVDHDSVVARMQALHERLTADPDVGVVMSAPLFLQEARRTPFFAAFTWRQLLDVPIVAQLGRSWIPPERDEALFFLRMREGGRSESRPAVQERLIQLVRDSDLEASMAGGLYDLQGQLAQLLVSSLRIGLTALWTLFLVIAFVVSRHARTTVAMAGALVVVGAVVLGAFGFAGASIDIISSPAANVALAIGVDSMIHLVLRVRRRAERGVPAGEAWVTARNELWRPIVGAALIISAGFGIFALSSFPPTQRFGIAVILGSVTAAATTLILVPFGAHGALSKTPEPSIATS